MNELKLESPESTKISVICAKEVNDIMTKYNCYFVQQVIFDDGNILYNTIIKEKKE
jgi:hypothetical protein